MQENRINPMSFDCIDDFPFSKGGLVSDMPKYLQELSTVKSTIKKQEQELPKDNFLTRFKKGKKNYKPKNK